jgi:methionyl-tRNA formyltransferase
MGREEKYSPFGVCAVGFKGFEYLSKLVEFGCTPSVVFSYRQPEDLSNSIVKIAEFCRSRSIDFFETSSPTCGSEKPFFFVGWQYLMSKLSETFIVLHDSLLPRYRGFAPTVNALINGEKYLGVTAFRPDDNRDGGAVLGQERSLVTYPVRIEEALRLQASLMARLTTRILKQFRTGNISASAQNEAAATYSIWRDENDYTIDWKESADKIRRTIDALSFPYGGAKVTLGVRTR